MFSQPGMCPLGHERLSVWFFQSAQQHKASHKEAAGRSSPQPQNLRGVNLIFPQQQILKWTHSAAVYKSLIEAK